MVQRQKSLVLNLNKLDRFVNLLNKKLTFDIQMNNALLYNKLTALPEGLKQEVAAFIERLLVQSKGKEQNKAKFGSAKGMITINPGFDEPLQDFSDYSY
jgi:hypothetical protein